MSKLRVGVAVVVAMLLLALGLGYLPQLTFESAVTGSPAAEPAPGPESVKAFNDWLLTYHTARAHTPPARDGAATDPAESNVLPKLEAQGVQLAKARRVYMRELIARDPEQALRIALDRRTREALPPAVRDETEKPFNTMGELGVLVARDDSTGKPRARVHRVATIEGRTMKAFTYGSRLTDKTLARTSMSGITLGDAAAIRPERYRMLAKGEAPTPGKKIADSRCPVSGKGKAKPEEPAVIEEDDDDAGVIIETGEQVYYLCHSGHIEKVVNGMIAAEGGTTTAGPIAQAPTNDPETTGAKSVLLIRVRFSDQTGEPQSESNALSMLAGNDTFIQVNSFGKTNFAPYAVTPVYTLPQTAQWYIDNDTSGYGMNVLSDARAVAANPTAYPNNSGLAAYNYTSYTYEAVRYNGGPGSFSGQAFVGARGCWLKSSSIGVAAHEFGHNLGLWHANYWATTNNASPIGAGSGNEYGDSFDTMGAASAGSNHFNASYKYELTWLLDADIQSINSSGVYRVTRHDHQSATGIRGLRVPRSPKDYWIEYRQLFTGNQWMMNGAGIRWKYNYVAEEGSQLLDMTPGSPDGKNDSPLVIGQTFSDSAAGIHITPIAKGGTSPNEWLDVQVNLGSYPSNNAPTLTLSASASTAGTGQAITFTATASDPDGDTLTYYWDFGDRSLSPNTASVNKSFSAAGQYRVRCTVSDMKGKTMSRSVIVTIGSPTVFTISGSVRDDLLAPVADALVTNGLATNDANYRYARTDSDGTYTIVNIPAGSYSVTCVAAGKTVTANGFTNPVTVGPNQTDINFTATETLYRISGTVYDFAGATVANAVVTDGTRTERTASNGTYTLYRVPAGSYTLTASKPGYVFGTASATVTNANVTTINVYEQSRSISGSILEPGSTTRGLNATVTTIAGTYSTTSTPTGNNNNRRNNYSVTVPAGIWNVRATATGYALSPSGWTNPVDVTSANASSRNFSSVASSATTYSISGAITDRSDPLANADVTITSGATVVGTSKTDSRGNFFVGGLATGTYTVTPTMSGLTFTPVNASVTITTADITGRNFATTRSNASPTITVAAAANPNPVNGTTTSLSVTATDDKGEESLLYTWSNVAIPSGASVTYDINGANASKQATATFNRAGSHTLRVTARDANNATATSDVVVTVNQTYTSLALSPTNTTIALGQSQQFTATARDQFAQPLTTQPEVTWSVSGSGTSISATGLFTTSAPGTFTVTATANGRTAITNITVGYPAGPGTGILREVWTNITGSTVATLTSAAAYIADTPTSTSTLTTLFEAPTNTADNYGQRVRGYFIAPVSGAYRFVIASDDSSQLFLSTSEDPAAKVLIASVSGSTSSREWTKFSTQLSATINLVAGQRYYIEALHKEGTGSDNLAVGVDLPGGISERPIPAHRLDPWLLVPKPTITITATDPQATEPEDIVPAPYIDDGIAQHPGHDHGTAADNGTFTITRTGDTTADLIVDLQITGTATSGSDYTGLPTAVTIPAGSASVTIDVAPLADSVSEGPETVIATIAAKSIYTVGTPSAATVTIGDADPPLANITASQPNASESGPAAGQFTITLSYAPSGPVTVSYTIAGTAANTTDYTTLSGSVAFAAGETSKPIAVTPVDDNIFEGSETVIATLAAGSGYTLGANTAATVTIADNDAAPTATIAATTPTANEAGPVNGQFTVTLSRPSSQATTVNFTVTGTATSGTDYTAIGTSVNVPAGNTTATITVTPISDATSEGNETVIVTLAAGTGYTVGTPGNATVTITDNNTAPTVASAAAVTASTATTRTLAVLGADNGGEGSLTYVWSRPSGPASVSFSANNSNAAKNTVATFTALGSYTLRATITDAQGLSVTSDVNVTVSAVATTITVTPSGITLLPTETQTYAATVRDQFNATMSATPTWSATGGTINTAGLYTAGNTGGDFTITATSGSASGQVGVKIFPTQLTGTPGNDTYTMRLSPNGQFVQMWVGADTGEPTFSIETSRANTITIQGGDGDDNVLIDGTNGVPMGTYGIAFDGGAGNNTITFNVGTYYLTPAFFSTPSNLTVNINANTTVNIGDPPANTPVAPVTLAGQVAMYAVLPEQAPLVPEIAVSHNGTKLTSGQTFNFGSTRTNRALTQTFTITNTGKIAATLGQIKLPAGYTLATAPATSLAPGAATTFSVRLLSKTVGTYSGRLELPVTDAATFELQLTGTVTKR